MKLNLFFFFLISQIIYSQNKSLLDSINIDKNTKLIGIYSQYDTSKTYQNLNFYIEDKAQIKLLIKKLGYENVVENRVEQNGFNILVLQGNNVINDWSISPAFSNIIIDGVYYKFDIDLIKKLAKDYPLDYRFYEKTFLNLKDYNAYLLQLKKDKAFLFSYEPLFEYEGSFEIEFPKNTQFDSPESIDEFLRPKIVQIIGDKEFNVSYNLDENNINNPNKFTITIEGSKEIFEKLNLGNDLKNKNWKDNQSMGMFFFKK